MATYMVGLVPEKEIPKDGWDTALYHVTVLVCAENPDAAKEMALSAMRSHNLHCRVSYVDVAQI